MKIAFAVEHFDGAKGGAEKYVWGFAQWLLREGHSLDVFTVGNHAEMAGARVHVLNTKEVRGGSRQLRFGYALKKELMKHRFDVVQGFNHAWPADVLMLHGGVHLAYEQFNALSSPTPAGRFLKRLTYRLQRKYRMLRRNEQVQFGDPSRRFIAVSHRVAQDIKRYYPSARDRIQVIHPGMDVLPYEWNERARIRGAFRERLQTPSGRTVFLFVSHNFRLKGLHDLIEAFPAVLKKTSDAELWVVGRGHPAAFVATAKRCGVAECIRFMGAVNDMREVYAAADVLVHPSYYDTFGGVCMEALACGLPIVMSNNCGASELMQGQRGVFTFDMPADRLVIADAMVQACSLEWGDEDRMRVSQFARTFPVEENYRAVLNFYEEGLKERC